MMSRKKIVVSVVILLTVGIIGLLVYRFVNRSTDSQFERLLKLTEQRKWTIFTSMTPEELRSARKRFKKIFTKNEAETFIESLIPLSDGDFLDKLLEKGFK